MKTDKVLLSVTVALAGVALFMLMSLFLTFIGDPVREDVVGHAVFGDNFVICNDESGRSYCEDTDAPDDFDLEGFNPMYLSLDQLTTKGGVRTNKCIFLGLDNEQWQGIPMQYDYCEDDTAVYEYYCIKDSANSPIEYNGNSYDQYGWTRTLANCPEGYYCDDGACHAPTCDDVRKNGAETDVDCGGSECGACALGKSCLVNGDCLSLNCDSGVCAPASCIDGSKNGAETDVDCGGSCGGCELGKACTLFSDCVSNYCLSEVCTESACDDTVMNGDETDVDCGGSCNACALGSACGVHEDCVTGVCDGTCQQQSCEDGLHNQDETDVDCGGTCTGCAPFKSCTENSDCHSNMCTANVCEQTETCKKVTKTYERVQRISVIIDPLCNPTPLIDVCSQLENGKTMLTQRITDDVCS